MSSSSSLFGVVIPGRPVITEFQVIDEKKCITFIESPSTVTDITFFLLPPGCIPPGYGAILYYAVPPFTNWVLLGCIAQDKVRWDAIFLLLSFLLFFTLL
jgi:hypothetical protein